MLREKKPERRRSFVAAGDLDIVLSGGFILQGSLRDLIALRHALRNDRRFNLVYVCNSSIPLYIVKRDEYALIQKLKEVEED